MEEGSRGGILVCFVYLLYICYTSGTSHILLHLILTTVFSTIRCTIVVNFIPSWCVLER